MINLKPLILLNRILDVERAICLRRFNDEEIPLDILNEKKKLIEDYKILTGDK